MGTTLAGRTPHALPLPILLDSVDGMQRLLAMSDGQHRLPCLQQIPRARQHQWRQLQWMHRQQLLVAGVHGLLLQSRLPQAVPPLGTAPWGTAWGVAKDLVQAWAAGVAVARTWVVGMALVRRLSHRPNRHMLARSGMMHHGTSTPSVPHSSSLSVATTLTTLTAAMHKATNPASMPPANLPHQPSCRLHLQPSRPSLPIRPRTHSWLVQPPQLPRCVASARSL